MADARFQFDELATRDDRRWVPDLKRRATTGWATSRPGRRLPAWLGLDLGMLALHPDALLHAGGTVSNAYLAVLRRLAADVAFRSAATAIGNLPAAHQDRAIAAIIEAVTRSVQGAVAAGAAEREELVRRLDEWLRARPAALGPSDLIAVRAAARVAEGDRLVDYYLVDECLRGWEPVPPHPLRTRTTPHQLLGDRSVSRRAGEVAGFTAVRPRLPNDPLISVLPSDWALIRRNRVAGVDKLLNRDTLVYERESPVDLVPRLRVLVAFVIDVPPGLPAGAGSSLASFRRGDAHVPHATRAKALAYRMIQDAARQVPSDVMEVDVAIHVATVGGRAVAGATAFDLRQSATPHPGGPAVNFDALAPFFFCHSRLTRVGHERPRGSWPDLEDDPFGFLAGAAAATATYSAVLGVLMAQPHRWEHMRPAQPLPPRPVEHGRDSVLFVQPDLSRPTRAFRAVAMRGMPEAPPHKDRFAPANDVDVRNAFLDMLLGPSGSAAGTASDLPIVLDRAEAG